MGAFKSSHFERWKVCYEYSLTPTMKGFKESYHRKSTQNSYGKSIVSHKQAGDVAQK